MTDKVTKKEVWQDMKRGVKAGVPRMDTVKSGTTLCIACFDCGTACPFNRYGYDKCMESWKDRGRVFGKPFVRDR